MWKKFVPENGDKKSASKEGPETNEPETKKAKIATPKASATTDDVRLGCRRLLATALSKNIKNLFGFLLNSQTCHIACLDKIQ